MSGPGECAYCRECGSCDAGLPMNCTCGPCTCQVGCGHPRCEGQPCDVCSDPEPCDCDDAYEDDYGYPRCDRCGGSGQYVPPHCCVCGGSPYCTCCRTCGAECIGGCTCPVTVQLDDGTTRVLT